MGFCDCPSGRAMAAGDGEASVWYTAAHSAAWPNGIINVHRCSPDRAATVAAWREAVEGEAAARADLDRRAEEYRRELVRSGPRMAQLTEVEAVSIALGVFLLGVLSGSGC